MFSILAAPVQRELPLRLGWMYFGNRPRAEVEALARKRTHVERMRSCNLGDAKKTPPEMSITGGWNPPNDKGGGGTVGGGEDQIIRCRVHLLCTLAYIEAK